MLNADSKAKKKKEFMSATNTKRDKDSDSLVVLKKRDDLNLDSFISNKRLSVDSDAAFYSPIGGVSPRSGVVIQKSYESSTAFSKVVRKGRKGAASGMGILHPSVYMNNPSLAVAEKRKHSMPNLPSQAVE